MSTDNIHASLVALGPHGVLIRGAAGSGKSSLALCLVRAARRDGLSAMLVADDRVDLVRSGDTLVGAPPPTLAGLVEISGTGIVSVPYAAQTAVDLVVDLVETPARLPEIHTTLLLGRSIRRIEMPVRAAGLGADIVLTLLDPATTPLPPDRATVTSF